MYFIFGILATLISIYSILILIRIVLSWFGSSVEGKPVELLSRITDPYLDWWRNNINFKIGFLDFSAVIGITALYILQNIFYTLSRFEIITLGTVLAIIILAAWSIVSFILIFCLVIIILRLIAYIANSDIYSPFWRMVDSFSQPVLYRLNRIMFGKRITNYMKGIVFSSILLAAIWALGHFAVPRLASFISRMPI